MYTPRHCRKPAYAQFAACLERLEEPGALVGAATMFCLWRFTNVNGYLYTVSGITTCVCVGYVASLLYGSNKDLTGLTLFTRREATSPPPVRKRNEIS